MFIIYVYGFINLLLIFLSEYMYKYVCEYVGM